MVSNMNMKNLAFSLSLCTAALCQTDAFVSLAPLHRARGGATLLGMSVPSFFDTFTSGLASMARLPFGSVVDDSSSGKKDTICIKSLYDMEGNDECRAVRERISELDLDVATVIPASKNARALKDPSDSYYVGTTDVIPIMEITNNNNEAQKFLGSKDILEFFDLTFGQRKPIIEETEEEWKTTLVKTMVGFGEKLPAFLRGNRGKTVAGCALPSGAPRPAEPLVLYSYEANQFCRLVREVLSELDIPYELKSAGKGSKKRVELEKISGSTQCPFLIDPNTGTQMSESKDIVKYLYKTYATYTPPNELLGSISGFITPVLKPIYKVLAPIQAGSQGDNKAEYQALVDQAKTSIQLEIKSNEVVVYTYALSPFCNEAKSLLNSLNVDFKEISLGKEWIPGLIDKIEGVYKRVALGEMTGQTSLPHIFVNGQSIGGLYEGLLSSLENGTFQQMLKDTKQTKELTPGWMKTIKKETAKEPAIAAKKETDKAPAPATKKKPSKESAKKSEQKAPAEEKKESSDVFDKVVKETFPGAISNDELLTKVVRVLDSKGYTSRNTLLATSLCCDELARALEDDFYEVYGKNFNLGGLAGFPFGGKTAFGAMSAHIPDNGNTLVVFGPHVGITQNGLVGKVERKGIKLVDTCCGSAIAASNYLKGITDGSTAVETQIKSFADFQQNAVKELILPHLTRLMDAENRMVELPYALYDSQNMLLSDIVKGKFDGLKKGTAILGGIQINTGPDSPDYFHPLRFDYIDGNGGASEDLLPLI